MATPPNFPSRPPPNYTPNPNPNVNPYPNPNPNPNPTPSSLPGSFQNLQISRPPPPSAATSRPISRPGPPPPAAAGGGFQPPITSNGPPPAFASGPPVGPPIGPPSSIRTPQIQSVRPFPGSPPATHQFSATPSQPPAPNAFPSNPNQISRSLPMGPTPTQSQPFAAAPSLPVGPTGSQPFATSQRLVSAPFTGSSNLSTNPAMQPQVPAGSAPFMGPTTAAPPFRGPAMSASTQPFTGPPTGAPTFHGPAMSAPAPPFMGPPTGAPPFRGPATSAPAQPFMGLPLPQPTSSAAAAPPFGAPSWQTQAMPGAIPGAMTGGPTGTMGHPMTPPPPPVIGYSPRAGGQVTPSRIDPNQIPRPVPTSPVAYFETRQGNSVPNPPPASSDFIVRDTGNCSPRLMRCTMSQIPCNGDILSQSHMPLAVMVQPFALPHPSEEPIQLVDFGDAGPLRCSRCKAYINPFMRFIDQGRRFICNLCGFTNETPRDYMCNLGPDGRRRDADERPELCRGTVEFVATKDFMVRDPMPAVYFFLIDVSMNAVQTGATAAACSAISQSISDLPEGPRTMVGVATFDCSIHFYNLKRSQQQPLMLIVPDIQDVYTPLQTDLIVPINECRESLEQLLESIPTMFQSNRVADSAFGAAIKAGFLAMKPTGGKLLVFQSVLPSAGIGSLSSREAEGRANVATGDKEAHKLLQPADKTLKTMAIEFAEYQVCVDVFLTTQTYVDIASISVVPSTTGGQIYYYYPFSAVSDPAKLYNDLRWNLKRPQGFEAVMRVRCSQGLQVQDYFGNFCKRVPTDIDLPGIDSDKTIMVTFKHDDKFQEGSECGFQCALLYTTVYGQRRIRVINLSLPCTSTLGSLFRAADLDSQFMCFLKQAANGIPASALGQVREQIMNNCINILYSYRKNCASVTSSGQLILPEALKLLPLYTLALMKSVGLKNDGRLDDRSYWASRAASVSMVSAVPLVYPRLISIHDLSSKEDDESVLGVSLPLSSEHLSDEGIYLMENGEEGLIYAGNCVNPDIVHQLFGVASLDSLPTQLVLQLFDNDLSRKLNEVVNEIRRQRCSYLRLRLCRKGDPTGMFFLSNMVEDKAPGGHSYVEFLVYVHRQIQTKMA